MNKYIFKGTVVGGIWGLISGVLYAFGAFLAGFSDRGDFGGLFKNIPVVGKILLAPAYLTDLISNLMGSSFLSIASFFGFFFIFVWCILVPILIGVAICATTSYLWQNFQKH